VSRPDSVLALLEHGLDPNRLSADGQHAPLLIAVGQKNAEIVGILLAHGANLDLQNSRGATALHIAAETAGSEAVIRILLAGSAKPRIVPKVHQDSPVDYAVMFKQKDNLMLLLQLCSVDQEVLDDACNCAAMRNYLDGVNILLDAGGNPNYVPKLTRNTALHYAVNNENAEMQKLLLSKGARTDVRNGLGLRPYDQNPRALRPATGASK
jgi:ankyrin repeat protein